MVVIEGSGFTGATAVNFGKVPAQSFTVGSDQLVEAVTPPGTGTVSVSVADGGHSTIVGQYTYQAVRSVLPSSGPAAGGTTVVIHGTGLGSTEAVYFGSVAAPFTQISDSEIDATSPPGTGAVDITVQTLSGQITAVSSGDLFTYAGTQHGQTAGSARIEPPRQALRLLRQLSPADLQSICGVSKDVTSFFAQVTQCLANAFGGKEVNAFQAAVAVVAADVAPPDCDIRANAWASIVQAAAQPAINKLLFALARAALPAVTGLVFGAMVGSPVLIAGLVAAAVVGAVIYVGAQLAANAAIQAGVEAAYKHLNCPPGTPGSGVWHGNVLVDPSGTVFDTSGHLIKGATVTILRADTAAGPFLPEAAMSSDIAPNVNPETTGAAGTFHWDVIAGWYEVSASAPGCTAPGDPLEKTVTIGPYSVPPPRLGLTIELACTGKGAVPAPAVSGLSVSAGPASGGTQLTVTGSNFTPASKVTFGKVAAASITYLSGQALQVTSPAGTGMKDVRVRTQGGTSAVVSADKFFLGAAPAVRKVTPPAGPDTGGSAVTITGTGFTGATAVSFGGLPAVSFRVTSGTSIQAVAPASLPGKAGVQVTNPAGVSSATSAAGFGYGKVTAYVATASGVIPVDPATGRAGRRIAVKGSTSVAIAPDGATAYVVSRASGTVTPVKVATGKAGKPIKVGAQPDAIAISPSGAFAYVVNGGAGTVTPIRLATGKVRKAIKVGQHPDAIAITASGSTAYVAGATGTVTPISLAAGRKGKPIRAGSGPAALAISSNGATLYVADFGTVQAHGATVTPIALATGKPGKAIRIGAGPDAVALTPGGLFALVASYYAGTVTPVRLSDATVDRAIKVAGKPSSIAITP